MQISIGYFWAKLVKYLNRPALRNCSIDSSAYVGPGSNCIALTLGRYSYIGDRTSLYNVRVGNFCSIASNCSIGGGAHPVSSVSSSPVFYMGRNVLKCNFSKAPQPEMDPVQIGNDVWVGEKVFIKDGIVIGDGAIIGANSVVTHDIPPYAVAVGSPARVIKYRFNDNIISKLLEIKWWNWEDDQLKLYGDYFSDVDLFLKKYDETF